MSLILSGSDGVSDIDGSAATPAIRGTDTNTGIFFPAADTIAFSEGGTEVARIDSAGNLGIGTTTPVNAASAKTLTIYDATEPRIQLQNSTTGTASTDGSTIAIAGADLYINNRENGGQLFFVNGAERMRIDSAGRLCINKTSGDVTNTVLEVNGISNAVLSSWRIGTNGFKVMQFNNQSNSEAGQITVNASSVGYGTSSDYRLKEDVSPMTGALAKITQLKPVTYKWKVDGSDGQGFIAHELQEVVPDCVNGEKDAVDEDGKPIHQSVDTSFLVATLTAAIQELKATVDAQAARIAALEGAAV
jgi:hypothetical protein